MAGVFVPFFSRADVLSRGGLFCRGRFFRFSGAVLTSAANGALRWAAALAAVLVLCAPVTADAAVQRGFGNIIKGNSFVARQADGAAMVAYEVIGGGPRFYFGQNGKSAQIRFACDEAVGPCGQAYPLTGQRGTGGDLLFSTADGTAVMRLTPAGGATLFGGAPFVPSQVPRGGVAVTRAED